MALKLVKIAFQKTAFKEIYQELVQNENCSFARNEIASLLGVERTASQNKFKNEWLEMAVLCSYFSYVYVYITSFLKAQKISPLRPSFQYQIKMESRINPKSKIRKGFNQSRTQINIF